MLNFKSSARSGFLTSVSFFGLVFAGAIVSSVVDLGIRAFANASLGNSSVVERGVAPKASEVAKAVTLQGVKNKSAGWDGQSILLKGRVKQVCQSKGCWFTLTDEAGGASVRITSKGYLFFVPKNTAGYDAVVQGTFHVKKLTTEEAAHFAKDAGQKVNPADLPTEEYRIEAVGVRLTPLG